MDIMDLLSGLLAVKQKAKLNGHRPHFCFSKNETLSFAIFLYILNTRLRQACPTCFLFYAILLSNSFTLVHFRTIARPL